jgi:hypothetical protein
VYGRPSRTTGNARRRARIVVRKRGMEFCPLLAGPPLTLPKSPHHSRLNFQWPTPGVGGSPRLVAEREGFEPPDLSVNGFQDRRHKPLGHLSAFKEHTRDGPFGRSIKTNGMCPIGARSTNLRP